MAAESAKLVVSAPKASIKINLRSIHDLSHLHCADAEIIINENFDKCAIFDQLSQEFVKAGDHQPCEDAPILKVLASKSLKITVMSDFEILRRRITDGMASRKKL